ncbi:MAG TPA: glycosyltransferase family 2 protein [Chloroflexota bacterium]
MPRVSVLTVSYNTRDLLLRCLGSLIEEPDIEAIVVDNASSDGSADAVAKRFPAVHLIRSESNLGFAGGTNRAACAATGHTLLLLNPDAALTPGALDTLLEWLDRHPRAAAVSPSMIYPNGSPQSAAFRFPGLVQLALDLFPVARLAETRLNGRVMASKPTEIDYALGACILIRRAAWQDVGPLDEGYFMYVEEIDWCRRARTRGWQVWVQPAALVVHHAGAATRQRPEAMFAQLWRSRLRYYQRYYGPFYNRVVRVLVQLGMRAEARRSPGRANAIAAIRQLVS